MDDQDRSVTGSAGPRDESAGWDFFVSYTQSDRAWAEWIAWELEEAGHRVLVQAWDFVPGTNWIQGMEDGASRAARTIAVLSADYLGSVYGGAEWQAAWAADPAGRDRKLLVVRVAECARPGLLVGVVGIDVFGVAEAKARARLRDMVSRALAGRAKPEVVPGFPGQPQRSSGPGGRGRAVGRQARFPEALPQMWNVPARNPNFTGREQALREVHDALRSGSTVTVAAVRGMGGVGKTQLANEYAYCHATTYDVIWWVAAEQPTAIADQFARLAAELGVAADGDPPQIAAAVHAGLRERAGWLLVFDNADQAADLAMWLPTAPMLAGIPGHVLVTTRHSGFGGLGTVLDLDVVTSPEAVRLMRARVPDIDEATARGIAEELDRLPLALEQAAAYIDRTGLTPAEFLALLGRRGDLLYRERRRRGIGRDEQVGATEAGSARLSTLWDLSLDRLAQDSPASAQLLGVCAYLAPDPIPLDLFTAHPDLLPTPLAELVADPVELVEVIAAIVDLSLAKRAPQGLQLHRLVQRAIRHRDTRTAEPSTPT